MSKRANAVRFHDHPRVSPNLLAVAQMVTQAMTGREGWFYAGRLGSELKIGISKGCPFCRMYQQRLHPLGLCFSPDCEKHEADMKVALGTPSHGAEFFSDCDDRFAWLVSRGFINELDEVAKKLALRYG